MGEGWEWVNLGRPKGRGRGRARAGAWARAWARGQGHGTGPWARDRGQGQEAGAEGQTGGHACTHHHVPTRLMCFGSPAEGLPLRHCPSGREVTTGTTRGYEDNRENRGNGCNRDKGDNRSTEITEGAEIKNKREIIQTTGPTKPGIKDSTNDLEKNNRLNRDNK